MSTLRITTIQSDLAWADPEANKSHFSQLLRPLSGQTDLVILPEMFSTGFFMDAAQMAETFPGPTIDWMRQEAKALNACLTGSMISEENGRYYNRLIWMQPDGHYYHYDKRHLFAYGGEDDHYSAGRERLIVRIGNWRVFPLICYDLRFPVWSRNTDPYFDLLIYVANWPSPRKKAWTKLLQARAIENQCYVAGVNRVGTDGNGNEYPGLSTVVGFDGEPVFESPEGKATVQTTVLSQEDLLTYRSRFPFLRSADQFSLLRE